MLEIREATLKDLEILLKMEQSVVDAERQYDSSLKKSNVKYYNFHELITSDQSILKIGIINSKIIGSGYAKIMDAQEYFKHKRYAYLGFMLVHPKYRGQGFNSVIINELLVWCKSQSVKEIRLDVYAENISAIKAYKKINFEERMIEMRLCLNE